MQNVFFWILGGCVGERDLVSIVGSMTWGSYESIIIGFLRSRLIFQCYL